MSEIEDTRHRILEAAGRKFAEKGFDGTNVREITEAVKASPAAVNYHFRSKEDLYVETVRHAARFCAEHASPLPAWPEGTPPEQKLRDFIRMFLSRLLRQDVPAWCRLLIMREVSEPRPGACEVFVQNFVQPTFTMMQQILAELIPEGVPVREVQLVGASIVGQCLHYHHARHIIPLLVGQEEFASYDLDRLSEHVWRFSLSAIRGLYPPRG